MADGKAGAPIGNDNQSKSKPWKSALIRAMAECSEDGDYNLTLRKIARKVVDNARDGDKDSILEIANRMDGKPMQAIVGDTDGDPIVISITATQAKL